MAFGAGAGPVGGGAGGDDFAAAAARSENDGSHASGLSLSGSVSVSLNRDQRAELLGLAEGDAEITGEVVCGVVGGASSAEVAALVELLTRMRGDRALVRGLIDNVAVGSGVGSLQVGSLVASAIDSALGLDAGVSAPDSAADSTRGLELAAIYDDDDVGAVAEQPASSVAGVAGDGVVGGLRNGAVVEAADDSAVLLALHEDERRRSAAGEASAIPVRPRLRQHRRERAAGGMKISAWLGTRGGRVFARAAMFALAAGLTIGGVALVGRALGPGLFEFGPIARNDSSSSTTPRGAGDGRGFGHDGLGSWGSDGSIAITSGDGARGGGNADGVGVDGVGPFGGVMASNDGGVRFADGSDGTADTGIGTAGGGGVMTERLHAVLALGPGIGSMDEAALLAATGRLGVRVVTGDLVTSAARTETLASVRSVGGRVETRWRGLDSSAAAEVCRAAGWSDDTTRLAGVTTPTAEVWARATSMARASIRSAGGSVPNDGAVASDATGSGSGLGIGSGGSSAGGAGPTFGDAGWSGVYAVRVSPEPEGWVRLAELVAPGATKVEFVRLDGVGGAGGAGMARVSKVLDASVLFGGLDSREALWWEGPARSWTWPTVVPVVIEPAAK